MKLGEAGEAFFVQEIQETEDSAEVCGSLVCKILLKFKLAF
jgi:hypothetical protein